MSETMKGFRCWTPDSVRQTVYSDIGALSSSADAIFLSAHTPMSLIHRRGVATRPTSDGENQILAALEADIGVSDRNTLIAVTGASGAGKSHVVRWVNAHLDRSDERLRVLYVPRAIQTLRELLRRIVSGLAVSGGDELLDRIDKAIANRTVPELRDRVLSEVQLALNWKLEHRSATENETGDERAAREDRNNLLGLADEQGKRRNGLADLLGLSLVNRQILRDNGLIDRVVKSVNTETSRRDVQLERFTKDDLPLRVPGMWSALRDNPELEELWQLVKEDPAPTLHLLGEALREAVPSVLGLRESSGETLDDLFRRSRRELRAENKELVLLFEDLAQFGLVDGELYDQFVSQPGDDLAPLRVLFAITNDPFARLVETVETRLTHHFEVDASAQPSRDEFIARYMNLVRTGRQETEAAWSRAGDTRGGNWMSNACDSRENGQPCRFRDECHAGFGVAEIPSLGSVGLYPYNGNALSRVLARLGADATPREILNVCLTETLIEADFHLERGSYPDTRVRDRFDFKVQRPKDSLLHDRTGDEAERLYRALVVWGNEEQLDPYVAEAFALDVAAARGPRPNPVPPKETPIPPPDSQTPRDRTRTPRAASPLAPLFQWQAGDPLPDRHLDAYRQLLHKMVVSRLQLDLDLFHTANSLGQDALDDVFVSYSFEVAGGRGRKTGAGKLSFELTPAPNDVRVLVAARWFSDHGHWRPEDGLWEWPEGYEPHDLMSALETRLDEWGTTVEDAYRAYVSNHDPAGAAVGLHAIAKLALGSSPSGLGTLDEVVAPLRSAKWPVLPAWMDVSAAATAVVNQAKTMEYVGQFGAVRQGSRGGAQLVDTVAIDAALKDALVRPVDFLRHLQDNYGDAHPGLAQPAHRLLRAMEKAAPQVLNDVSIAVEALATSLEGHPAKAVAEAADSIGKHAIDAGLFRPANGRDAYTQAIGVLKSLSSASVPLGWRPSGNAPTSDEALKIQRWASAAVAGASALALIRKCLGATTEEAERRTGLGGDVSTQRQAVRDRLGRGRQYVEALSLKETNRG